MTRTSNHITRQ